MAAALLRSVAPPVAAGDPSGLTVLSCGLLESGHPVLPEVVTALSPYGVDLTGHQSTQLTASAVEGADLVLGLERRHCREAILLVPPALDRTFSLKELVRRGEKVGSRAPGQSLPDWLALVAEGRERASLIGRSPEDDVADPLGGDLSDYRATAAEIDDLVRRLSGLLWPPSDA
jgi:protein-tyrosine phosphatase